MYSAKEVAKITGLSTATLRYYEKEKLLPQIARNSHTYRQYTDEDIEWIRALEYFVYACKQQLFWDGNKRTSTMVASKILIENGEGILTIGKDNAHPVETRMGPLTER